MLYVIARSAGQGRRAGLVSALGIAAGSLIQTGFVALGLASILATVPLAYDLVKFVGAGYLMYLGIRTLLQTDPWLVPRDAQRDGGRTCLAERSESSEETEPVFLGVGGSSRKGFPSATR